MDTIERYTNTMEKINDENKELSQLQIKNTKIYSGNDIIRIKKVDTIDFTFPIEEFEFKKQSWNCKHEIIDIDKNIKRIKISTSIIILNKHHGFRWYTKMWIEYDGKKANKDKISQNNIILNENQNNIIPWESKFKVETNIFNENNEKHRKYKKEWEQINNKYNLLSQEFYTIEDIITPIILIQEERSKNKNKNMKI